MKHKKYCKVIDHCYYTGKHRGVVHGIRNLKYSVPKMDLTMIIIVS